LGNDDADPAQVRQFCLLADARRSLLRAMMQQRPEGASMRAMVPTAMTVIRLNGTAGCQRSPS